MNAISLLGSTGSVGVQTLEVIADHPDKFDVIALAANQNVSLLLEQIQQFTPKYVAVADPQAANQLKTALSSMAAPPEVLAGEAGVVQAAQLQDVDTVVAVIVGGAGLQSTWAAVQAGKRILLANKESLVMAGALIMAEARSTGATLIPLDSEHSALMQCLPSSYQPGELRQHKIEKITLTASGGPFLNTELSELSSVTPAQACAHPTWQMGAKISVDSATLVNKGLEVIEAHWLFGVPSEQIEVVIHPQSCIHALVQYADGSVLSHMGTPDMRTPIAYGLAWPERIETCVAPLDFKRFHTLQFVDVDHQRFPGLSLAYAALEAGGGACTVLNAANEMAVSAFLEDKIRFTDIPVLIKTALDQVASKNIATLEAVIQLDLTTRQWCQATLEQQVTDCAT